MKKSYKELLAENKKYERELMKKCIEECYDREKEARRLKREYIKLWTEKTGEMRCPGCGLLTRDVIEQRQKHVIIHSYRYDYTNEEWIDINNSKMFGPYFTYVCSNCNTLLTTKHCKADEMMKDVK